MRNWLAKNVTVFTTTMTLMAVAVEGLVYWICSGLGWNVIEGVAIFTIITIVVCGLMTAITKLMMK